MKNRILIVFIFILSTERVFATGQASELIIYEGDTLELLSTPLENFLGDYEQRITKYPFLDGMCSTRLYRNYVGIWKVENSELQLIEIFKCGERDKSLLGQIFNENSPIKAEWYSGELFIQKGKIIKYNHDGFQRVYEQEIIVQVEQGIVKNQEHFYNGYRPDDIGFLSDPDSIMAKVHNMINWDDLPELSKDFKIYVNLTTGKNDSLSIVKSFAPELYITELQRVINEFPELKKFYSRGEPYGERKIFPVVFSENQRRRFAR